jgi:hypothetical protein
LLGYRTSSCPCKRKLLLSFWPEFPFGCHIFPDYNMPKCPLTDHTALMHPFFIHAVSRRYPVHCVQYWTRVVPPVLRWFYEIAACWCPDVASLKQKTFTSRESGCAWINSHQYISAIETPAMPFSASNLQLFATVSLSQRLAAAPATTEMYNPSTWGIPVAITLLSQTPSSLEGKWSRHQTSWDFGFSRRWVRRRSSDERGSKRLRNVSKFPRNYTVQYPTKQSPSTVTSAAIRKGQQLNSGTRTRDVTFDHIS